MGDCFRAQLKEAVSGDRLVTVCAGLAPSVVATSLTYLLWLLSGQ